MFIIDTKRCYLREFSEADLPSFMELCTDPQVRKFMGGAMQESAIREIFSVLLKNTKKYNRWAIIHRVDHKFIGEAGLTELFEGEIELGYSLLPQYWGKGLATEVAKAIGTWAFTNLNIANPL
jgi:ribosomal-protein-alanine N-acetyltransferase